MTKKKASKKTAVKKKMTIKNFQAWLEGIMEFQEDDWSPNSDQWNAIYTKIMNLQEDKNSFITKNDLDEISENVDKNLHKFFKELIQYQKQIVSSPQPTMQQNNQNSLNEESLTNIVNATSEQFPDLSREEIEERIKALKQNGEIVSDPNQIVSGKTIRTAIPQEGGSSAFV